MSGALEVPKTGTPAAKPIPQPAASTAAPQPAAPTTDQTATVPNPFLPDHTTPIPPAPKPAQGLNIVLKPGLETQGALPETTAGAGGAPAQGEGAISPQDPEAAQAAAEMMQGQPVPGQATAQATAPTETGQRTLRDLIMPQGAPPKPAAASPLGVVGDIATGVAEVPKAVVGGVRDAGQELLSTTKSVADWLNTNVGDLGSAQVFDAKGNFDPQYFPAGSGQPLTGHLPEVGAQRSVTGSIERNVVQFLAGFAVGGKVLGAYADSAKVGQVASTFVRSAFSDAFAFNPAQERLSNLVESVPALRNPVTHYLASGKGDTELEGRIKNALEGAGIGAAIIGLAKPLTMAIKGMRAARALGHAPPAVDTKALGTALGTSEAPLVSSKSPLRQAKEKASVGSGPPERIVAAAVRDKGKIYSGVNHADALEQISDSTGEPIESVLSRDFSKEGFLTSYGRYVDRAEAAKIAAAQDQIAPIGDLSRAKSGDLVKATKELFAEQIDAGTLQDGKGQAKVLLELGTDPQGNAVFINHARIESPEDVKAIIQKTANQFSSDVAQAQRGKISHEATQGLADDLGMTVDDLLSRQRASSGARAPFTAEEALAARRLLTAAGTKLLELAKIAAAPNAGEIDLFNFRRMMATHYAIQQEVLGARTETARALASWRIGAGSGEAQMRAIQAAMEAGGGMQTARQMADALAVLDANKATPGAVSRVVRQGALGNTIDAIREAYVGGLLSNPLTHIVNCFSNFLAMGQQIYERKAAYFIGQALNTQDGVGSHEAAEMAYTFFNSQADAFRLAWKAARTGETTDLLGKVDVPHPSAISAETWGIRNGSAGGRVIDVLGKIFRTPMLLMGGEDQYFKTILYRMEVNAQAESHAIAEGHTGAALADRIKELVANPSEELKIAAADEALYATFNNKMGWFGRAMMSLREGGGPLNPTWMVMPFVRTPVNVVRYAFERTPLAPLVGQWRADIAAGGRRRDLALARLSTGTVIMGIAQSMAESGLVSGNGPSDRNERANWLREGHQPYSVRVGDKWYSYNRSDPFGTTMGFAADMQDFLGRGDVAPDKVDEWQEVSAGGIAAISQTVLNKTFLSGVAGFINMLSDPTQSAPSEIDRQLAAFMPGTGLSGAITRAIDPTARDARDPWQAIEARIPGLAESLIPRRDLWGQKISYASGNGVVYDTFSPLQAKPATQSPVDAELERLRVFPSAIGWKTTLNNVHVDFSEFPQTLDHYRELAGNGYKNLAWNMGLKDFLDATVSGKGPLASVYRLYSDGDQGGKAAFIKQWIERYRNDAARELLADPKYAAFRAYWEQQKASQRALSQKINVQ